MNGLIIRKSPQGSSEVNPNALKFASITFIGYAWRLWLCRFDQKMTKYYEQSKDKTKTYMYMTVGLRHCIRSKNLGITPVQTVSFIYAEVCPILQEVGMLTWLNLAW